MRASWAPPRRSSAPVLGPTGARPSTRRGSDGEALAPCGRCFQRRLRRRNRCAGDTAAGDRWGVSGGAASLPPTLTMERLLFIVSSERRGLYASVPHGLAPHKSVGRTTNPTTV